MAVCKGYVSHLRWATVPASDTMKLPPFSEYIGQTHQQLPKMSTEDVYFVWIVESVGTRTDRVRRSIELPTAWWTYPFRYGLDHYRGIYGPMMDLEIIDRPFAIEQVCIVFF